MTLIIIKIHILVGHDCMEGDCQVVLSRLGMDLGPKELMQAPQDAILLDLFSVFWNYSGHPVSP